MKSYRVFFERDDAGWWIVRVPGIPGCHTQGRTIEQARERIREALGLFVRDVDGVRLREVVAIPAVTRRKIERARRARARAEAERSRAQAALVVAARDLVAEGLSLRDAGEVLGISRQRVQQLVGRHS